MYVTGVGISLLPVRQFSKHVSVARLVELAKAHQFLTSQIREVEQDFSTAFDQEFPAEEEQSLWQFVLSQR